MAFGRHVCGLPVLSLLSGPALAATTEWFVKSDSQPTVSFGVFDHLDEAGGSLQQQYADRLKIAVACDLAGFRAYHVAEHHGTPHGLAGSPNLFLSVLALQTKLERLVTLGILMSLYHLLCALGDT